MSPSLLPPPSVASSAVDPLFMPKPMGPLTESLARVLGHNLMSASVPAATSSDPNPTPLPAAPAISEVKSAVLDSMMQTLQGHGDVPPSEGPLAPSLEGMRQEMFGRYYDEIEGRMRELRQTLDGGVGRARRAMLERVDELGAALHRDMVALRQEVQKELEDLKRDVFTTVMSVSAINDRIGLGESRNRETMIAVTKALTDRIDQQAKSCSEAISSFRDSLDESLDKRVMKTVETTLMKMAAARRSTETVAV